LEDAFKLGILSSQQIKELYLNFYDAETEKERLVGIERTLLAVTDRNEQISYLRANVIGKLIYECNSIFIKNHEEILAGTFTGSLIDKLEEVPARAMQKVQEISIRDVYGHRSVVEIEIAGYKIIGTILEEFVEAVMNADKKDQYSRKLLSLLPDQYKTDADSAYLKIQSIVDFVSGMTDIFALDLYRKIKGISLPGVV
jgi:dGTPase